MWYEAALQQMGVEKSLELDISLVPHTENPDRALKELRGMLNRLARG